MIKSDFNVLKTSDLIKTSGNLRTECLTDISCNVSDIISLSANVTPKQTECLENEVKLSGRIIFNVVYNLEGEIRRKEIGQDFSETISLQGVSGENLAKVSYTVEGLSSDKTDRLNVYAMISYALQVEFTKQCKILSEGEGCICDKLTFKHSEDLGRVTGVFTLEDEFETQTIKNVLSSSATAIVNNTQCGIGAVICDGEIILSLLLLPNQEKSDILKEKRIIPFRLEVEAPQVTVNDSAFVNVVVNKTSLKVYIDETKNKADICSSVTISLNGNAYSIKDVEYVDDLFSCESEISLAKEKIEDTFVMGNGYYLEKCMGKAFCQVPENARLIDCFDERVYGVTYKQVSSKLNVEGIACCNALFEIAQGKTTTVSAELPFNVTIDCEEFIATELSCITRGVTPKIRNGEVEIETEICISYKKSEIKNLEFISSLEEKEKTVQNDSAFSLYIAQKGDSLWNVCKALKVAPKLVTAQNPELSYPLQENEKIIIYRQI